ncbi:MAG TPA: nuclear transport factor 2 family protein [Arenicellales bacterium]|nr:nuclear transport factor 2 family protein [Arenicellales bacterium]
MSDRSGARSPDRAEELFYTAFETGDIDTMAGIWAQSEEIVCVHPNGPQLVGYGRIMQSWRSILENTAGFRVSVRLIHHYVDGNIAVRFVNETLINERSDAPPVTVLATNAYRRTGSGWQMVLHHASPAPRGGEPDDDADTDAPAGSVTLH